MFTRSRTHFTLVAAALSIAAPHAHAITIPIAVGSPGTTINEFSIPVAADT
ncbi:MAG: hypothetical protein AAGD11_19275 [Planctomycetota bacterium]